MSRVFRDFRSFSNDEQGAVTVDWVMLTALMVGMAALGVASIGGAAGTIGTSIVDSMTKDEDSPET